MSFAFAPEDVSGLPIEQKIAIMESFMIAVIADAQTPEAEAAQLEREIGAIDWGLAPDELQAHLKQVRARVLALREPNQAVALIRSVTSRIVGADLREKVFRAMAAIMVADDRMAKTELAVLTGYAKLFGLSDDRYEAIKADVLAVRRG